ncbi:MAG: FecR domain-containing protein, partial [Oscillospiraceae bacterium]
MSVKEALAAISVKVKILIVCAAVVIAGGITAAVLISSNKADTYRVLKVFELTGSAVISREGTGDIDAYVGMNLESGDTLTVGEKSTMRISMDGDKYVLLDSGTVLELVAEGTPADSRTSIVLKKGTILNELTTSLSANSSYEVSTPKATMAVRGTSFIVSVEQNEDGSYTIRTNTLHGMVEVILMGIDGKPTGESAMVPEGKSILIKTVPDPESGNPAEVDGTSFFVYENENGVFVEVPKGSDPVTEIVYEYISAVVKEYACRSNDDGTMVLEDYIIKRLRESMSDEANSDPVVTDAADVPSDTSSESTTAASSKEEGSSSATDAIVTTTAPSAAEADAAITTTVPTATDTDVTITTEASVNKTGTHVTTTVPPRVDEEPIVTTVPSEINEDTVTMTVPTVTDESYSEISSTPVADPEDSESENKTTAAPGHPMGNLSKTTSVPHVTTWTDTVVTTSVSESVTTTVPASDSETTTTVTVPTSDSETTTTVTVPEDSEATTTAETVTETTTTVQEIEKFIVCFVCGGEVLYDEEVENGGNVSYIPDIPEQEGYTAKWVYNGSEFTSSTEVTSDITVTAEYTIKTYTVTFKVDENTSYERSAEHGGNVSSIPDIPEQEGYTAKWVYNG